MFNKNSTVSLSPFVLKGFPHYVFSNEVTDLSNYALEQHNFIHYSFSRVFCKAFLAIFFFLNVDRNVFADLRLI